MRILLLLSLGVILGLLTAEIALHIAIPSLDFHFPIPRLTDDHFTGRANQEFDGNGVHYAFDADGFRSSGVARAAPAQPAILFIGDSFTQGFGVNADEAFPAATCDELQARGVTARCLNAGTTGFGTSHELRLLRRLLDRRDLKIDAVVFQTCAYNDLRDNWEDGGFALADGRLVQLDPPRIPLELRIRDALLNNRVARSSRTVTLLANAWLSGPTVDEKSNASTFELERVLLKAIDATVKQYGVPLVVVLAATSWELDLIPSQPYDERGRLDFFAALANGLHVPVLDTRTIARQPDDYLANDGHLAAAGNALLGKALAEQLAAVLRSASAEQRAATGPVSE